MAYAKYPCPLCQPDSAVLAGLGPAAYEMWESAFLERLEAAMARAKTTAKISLASPMTQRPTSLAPEASRSLSTSGSDATAGSPETLRP